MRRSIVSLILLSLILFLSSVSVFAQEDNAQRNKQIYLDVVGEYNAGNREAFYNMVTDPFMMNQGEPILSEMAVDDLRGYDSALAGAMPDIQMNPSVIIAQDDWVAVHMVWTGTFTQPFSFAPFGPDAFEPNNEAITWTEMQFMRFNEDGLGDTVWITSDPTVLFGQMGMLPPMDGNTDTPLEQPVGYQTLSADDLAATYTSGMEERNTVLYQELIDAGLGLDNSFYADPYISWGSGVPFSVDSASFEEDGAFFAMINSAMPDNVVEAPVVVAEGDWVAVLVQISGTYTEDVDFFGATLTATDESIVWQLGLVNRFDADGMIIEEFVETDATPLLIGLGMMPPMGE